MPENPDSWRFCPSCNAVNYGFTIKLVGLDIGELAFCDEECFDNWARYTKLENLSCGCGCNY